MIRDYLRRKVYRYLTHQNQLSFDNIIPSEPELKAKFEDINELGIYLHIPFCKSICPYCPYNKVLFNNELATRYKEAVLQEIDYYSAIAGNRPITSFYIGGGTPTSMIRNGLEEVIAHIYRSFNMQCGIHIESHPTDISKENLSMLRSFGVKYLSMGVEALEERHLLMLQRNYSTREAKKAIENAVSAGFECVNIDYIFALPGQTYKEVEKAGNELVGMGIHQAATYPLFNFLYTKMGRDLKNKNPGLQTLLKRRKMLRILEEIFYSNNFIRSSVWAFTRKGTDKYCSVTVPLYLGLGVSGGSYLKDIFFLNTFNVPAYIKSVANKKNATALSVSLTDEMQMSAWLYWRIYETAFKKDDFTKRFNTDFDQKYGSLMKFLHYIGYLNDSGKAINLTDRGAYWLHAFEDWYSIDFISKLWGNSKDEPWPEHVRLLDGSKGS